ncbi:MAG: HAMP domain-containing histidine kinase, partial [Bacteroidia bacterium]|nr:HAMP domain-containing histidine kinase [Bacteroidia bacterium]
KAEKALKDSEEQLLVYAGELEKKVMARTQDLNSTVQKLERANAFLQEQIQERQRAEEEARKALERERELNDLKSKFVSIASHEFRTPLSTVLSSASLVSQYHVRGEQEKVEKHVHRIKVSVNHLTGILNDFLSLGKLEEGKVDLVKEDIDLSTYLQEICEELRPQLKAGQSLSLDLDPTISTIVTDSRILRNILFNLISNASKYSDEHKPIKCRTRNLNGSLTIAVEDQGMGIPEEEQKHMFERFYRASNVTNIQGSGLGLNIVKRYLELLNGTITFASSYGRGSTFIITVPTH